MLDQIKLKNNSSLATLIIFAFVAYGFYSQYLWESVLAGIVLALIVTKLWISYLPPVLVFLFTFQWIQIFAVILLADYNGQKMEALFEIKDAGILVAATFIQLGCLAAFLSSTFKIKFKPDISVLKKAVDDLDIKKILTAYLIATLIFPTLIAATRSSASISQLVQAFSIVRTVLFILLIFIVFLKKTTYRDIIVALIVVEFLLSFVSYFSSFKDIIFYIIVVYLTTNANLKPKLLLRGLPIAIALVMFLVFWSNVKGGYRAFLNKGSNLQNVSVSNVDALGYLADKATEFDSDSFKTGGEALLYRIQYMEQYSIVYNRVPEVLPHENGKNLTSAINFILIPRYLNPDKAILDPSSKTTYYTGIDHKNTSEGTSISMGYFCDMFIDFGLYAMLIPLLLITFLIGKTSNYIINNKKYNLLFRYALFVGIIINLGTFESDIIYYLGTIRNYLAVMIVGNWFLFEFINKYITYKKEKS